MRHAAQLARQYIVMGHRTACHLMLYADYTDLRRPV
jgi:hypothetical protein